MNPEKRQIYLARRNDQGTVLLRIYPDEEQKAFEYDISYAQIVWVYRPELDEILTHRDRFPEYIDLSEEEADECRKELAAEHDRLEKVKNRIYVKHEQKRTPAGIVDIDIYYKGNERRSFQKEELEKLLYQIISMDNMKIRRIEYSHFDDWGYEKSRVTTDKEEIPDICDAPLMIDGYFNDRENNYRFRYVSRKETVAVARCRKDSGIDLHSVFDDEKG